jgi:hypothetical protein
MPTGVVDSASWTVPLHVDEGGAANGLFGATMEHPVGAHDLQLHVHGTPEPVWKATDSTAPAATS